jgi:recombinational DNA repair protein RecR
VKFGVSAHMPRTRKRNALRSVVAVPITGHRSRTALLNEIREDEQKLTAALRRAIEWAMRTIRPCPDCGGSGRDSQVFGYCPRCDGAGEIRVAK